MRVAASQVLPLAVMMYFWYYCEGGQADSIPGVAF